MTNKITKEKEDTLYCIITGVFLNGFLRGNFRKKINQDVIIEAKKEIIKLFK